MHTTLNVPSGSKLCVARRRVPGILGEVLSEVPLGTCDESFPMQCHGWFPMSPERDGRGEIGRQGDHHVAHRLSGKDGAALRTQFCRGA